MKERTDWTERVRQRLRETELAPPERGWERIEAAWPSPEAASERRMPFAGWRRWRVPLAAAAAAGLLLATFCLYPTRPPIPADPGIEYLAANKAADEAAGKTEDRTAGDSSGKTMDKTAHDLSDKTAGDFSGKTADKATHDLSSKTADKTTGDSSGKTADKEAAGERHSTAEEWQRPADPQQPESDKRQPETESQEPRTSSQQPTAESRQSTIDNQQPAADNQPSAADNRQPGTNNRQTANGNRQPTTGNRQPAAGPRRPAGSPPDLRAYAEAAGGGSKPARRTTRRVALALFGSGSLQNSRSGFQGLQPSFDPGILLDASFTANGSDLNVRKQNDYAQSTFNHRRPWSIGVSLRHDLGHGCSLETGLIYTCLHSEVTTRGYRTDQRLHFVGIPLRLHWAFVDRPRVGLYVGAGGMVERCVSARLGSERRSEHRMQGSVGALLGAEYRFSSHAALYFEPEWSYYLTDTRLRTMRTDDPGAMTLRVGIRFGF